MIDNITCYCGKIEFELRGPIPPSDEPGEVQLYEGWHWLHVLNPKPRPPLVPAVHIERAGGVTNAVAKALKYYFGMTFDETPEGRSLSAEQAEVRRLADFSMKGEPLIFQPVSARLTGFRTVREERGPDGRWRMVECDRGEID